MRWHVRSCFRLHRFGRDAGSQAKAELATAVAKKDADEEALQHALKKAKESGLVRGEDVETAEKNETKATGSQAVICGK